MSCRAFTLIELLVVISIIAVLAALLLPAIQTVKALAQTAHCAQNQRSIGMAIITYTQDWNGILPPVRRMLPNSTAVYWDSHLIGPELFEVKSNNSASGNESVSTSYNWASMGNESRGVFRCPARPERRRIWVNNSEYGLNSVLMGGDLNYSDPTKTSTYGVERLVPISTIRKSAATYLLADTARNVLSVPDAFVTQGGFTAGGFVVRSGVDNNGLHDRHRHGLNMLFADLHVEWLARNEIPTNETTGISTTILGQSSPWAANPGP